MNKTTYTILEVAQQTGIEESVITTCIEREWVSPPQQEFLDEEDIARLRLIQDLRSYLGVNEEAVPVILHLVDQLFHLRAQLKRLGEKQK